MTATAQIETKRSAALQAGKVSPRCVFAAGRQSFEVVVRIPASPQEAKSILFSALPLSENGWDKESAKISRVGMDGYWPIWRLARA